MEKINSCRVCQSWDIKKFFDFGNQPLANSLPRNLEGKEKFYPLSLSWCEDCNLVQLNETVEPEELFSEYIWVTATSKTAREYAGTFYQEVISRAPQTKEGYVLEVASNDGTFLIPFINSGRQVLGVDPARNISKIAEVNGIPTKCCFFGLREAKKLLEEQGPAKIIFARNVLPHVADTRDFVQGLEMCLSKDGLLAVEVHYAKKVLDGLHYDSIYHEHLCYFTLKSLEKLLNNFNLYIFDISESPISGGSIVVYAKKQKIQEMAAVQNYREQEKEDKTNNFESWQDFTKKANNHREKLLEILRKASRQGLVAGYGASARSSTMLNFAKINYSLISVIADQNPLKQGRFTAGSHIPIESPEYVMSKNPKFILILAWNFAEEIIKILRDKLNYKGRIIIPLPEVKELKEL